MPEEERDDLSLLTAAAAEAGEIALRHFRSGVEFWDKGDGQGPVSKADLEVDEMLRGHLCPARPAYGWLSEESEEVAPNGSSRTFVVDPIDGTRAFLKGEPGFATALAVIENGAPVAAVVHLPAREETYAAALGRGATLGGVPIAASVEEDLNKAKGLGAKPQLAPALWPGGEPPFERHFRPSIAWRLCLVASARFDLMLTLRASWDWDVAAGALIAAEAGAKVTDGQGGPLYFGTGRQAGVIAAPPALHAKLLALRLGPPAD